nr:hypothetical protein [Arsenophonus endosymbiont of Bemisia tabaci]
MGIIPKRFRSSSDRRKFYRLIEGFFIRWNFQRYYAFIT